MATREQLLVIAQESENTANILFVVRGQVPEERVYITTLNRRLAEIAERLTTLDDLITDWTFAASAHRVQRDIALVLRSLRFTFLAVREHVARSGPVSYRRAWEDLLHRMSAEGVPLLQRFNWYADLLDASVNIVKDRPCGIDRRQYIENLTDLLQDQISMPQGRRIPATASWDTRSPLSSPDSILRPPWAPEPLSPTWTNDSRRTMESSQTSWSAGSSPSSHWAQNIFDGQHPQQQFGRGYTTDEQSHCTGEEHPDAKYRLGAGGYHCVLQLPFDDRSVWVQLWYQADKPARILFSTRGGNSLHCLPLTVLRIMRQGSTLQLCRMRNNGRYERWALLNFGGFERMALFYSSFVAMKRQDGERLDSRMIEPLSELREDVEFHGVIQHGGLKHNLRLLTDVSSGVCRLEASPLRGDMAEVPLWCAFVNRYLDQPDWAEGRLRSSKVHLAALRPKPYVFAEGYLPLQAEDGWILDFVQQRDAKDFISNWTRVCRTAR